MSDDRTAQVIPDAGEEVAPLAGHSSLPTATDATNTNAANDADDTLTESIMAARSCPADEETVAAFNILMDHKGFKQNAERDIAMLEVTSRELEDFVANADDYKDEYFDITRFVSTVEGVWEKRRPSSPLTVKAKAAAAQAAIEDAKSVSSPTRNQRVIKIFPHDSAILVESQDRNQQHADQLRAADAAYDIANGNTAAVQRSVLESQHGLIDQRQPGMTRRIQKNEERRRIFNKAMGSHVAEKEAQRRMEVAAGMYSVTYSSLAEADSTTNANGLNATRNISLKTVTHNHNNSTTKGDNTTAASNSAIPTYPMRYGSACSNRERANTTLVPLASSGIPNLPPLAAAMTGCGGLPPHLKSSADGSKTLQPEGGRVSSAMARPDALSAMNLDRTSLYRNVTPEGLNLTHVNAAGNTFVVPKASDLGARVKPKGSSPLSALMRGRPFACDLTDPALSTFSPHAYANSPSAHPSHNRAPEVDRAAKALQQRARERKAEAARAKAIAEFGEDAEIAEKFGTVPQKSRDALGGLTPSGAAAAASDVNAVAGSDHNEDGSGAEVVAISPSRFKTRLEQMIAEQQEGLDEQERKHEEEYIPMLVKYYEYHDLAQRKLDAIAGMTGMDGSRQKGMGIPPKPALE